jgi:TRAP transporter TAXI family solute receptor
MKRRSFLGALATVPVAAGLAGCTTPEDASGGMWHSGELIIGTGNTTGVFYVLGAGYAGLVNRHLSGYDATATPTGGSIDNLQRLFSGDVDIALTLAAAADDAFAGTGNWAGKPQPVRALARTYNNFEHVIARVDRKIDSVADFRGKKISIGSPGSGSELIGKRLITAAGLDPSKDIIGLSMSLPQTTAAILDGSIDALIWSGGIPTPGVVDLFAKAQGAVRFLPIQDLVGKVDAKYPNLLDKATIQKNIYNLPADVPALTDANLIVVTTEMPADLAFQLTKLIFDYQKELIDIHPAARTIHKETASATEPVPLHPGAQRYYLGI